MAETCFVSYNRQDQASARFLKSILESIQVEVFMYDPDSLWRDPVTILVEALSEIDCIVNLDPGIRSPWVEAELQWARENQRPVINVQLDDVTETGCIVALSPNTPPKTTRRGDRFIRAYEILCSQVGLDTLAESDFFTVEDWFLLLQIEPLIPDLNQLFSAMRGDDIESMNRLAKAMGARIGHLFIDLGCLARYLDMASAAHPLVFSGYGIPTTANESLAKLSQLTIQEMSELLPMGLKRLRGVRDGTLKEYPRI